MWRRPGRNEKGGEEERKDRRVFIDLTLTASDFSIRESNWYWATGATCAKNRLGVVLGPDGLRPDR